MRSTNGPIFASLPRANRNRIMATAHARDLIIGCATPVPPTIISGAHIVPTKIMVQRPQIEEETVAHVDEELGDVMKVPPETVALDRKINILLDELERERNKNQRTTGSRGSSGF